MATNRNILFFTLFLTASRIEISSGFCTSNKYSGGSGYSLKCSNTTLNDVLVQANSSVSTIFVYQSNIPKLHNASFSRLGNTLVQLKLQHCQITDIELNAFQDLRVLKELSLSANNISKVHAEWFQQLYHLEVLDLSFNFITNIQSAVYERLHGVKNLDLIQNKLSCIRSTDLKSMTSLTKIRFEGNPLQFSCRANLTLSLRDRKINYRSATTDSESSLDEVSWQCLNRFDGSTADALEVNTCVIFELFKQLSSGMAASFNDNTKSQCLLQRKTLENCVKSTKQGIDNGEAISRLLLAVRAQYIK